MGFGEWRAQMEAIVRAQGLAGQQQIDLVMGALEGRAKREAMLFTPEQKLTLATLWTALQDRFGSLTPVPTLRSRFFDCKQNGDESVQDYLLRTRELFSRWFKSEPDGSAKDQSTLCHQFVKGLKEGPLKQELQRHMRRQPEMTFVQISAEAEVLAGEMGSKDCHVCRTVAPPLAGAPATVTVADLEEWKRTMQADLRQEMKEQLSSLTETLVKEVRQHAGPAVAPQHRGEPRGNVMEGQYIPFSGQRRTQFRWDKQGRPICLECGQPGHVQRNCPSQRTDFPLNQNPRPL